MAMEIEQTKPDHADISAATLLPASLLLSCKLDCSTCSIDCDRTESLKSVLSALNKHLQRSGINQEVIHIKDLAGLDSEGEPASNYAFVEHCKMGTEDIVLKMVGGKAGSCMDCLPLDKEALENSLERTPKLLGVINDADGALFCIAMTYLDGIPSDTALKDGTISEANLRQGYTELFQHIHDKGFIVNDQRPDNFVIVSDGTIWLRDGGAITKRDSEHRVKKAGLEALYASQERGEWIIPMANDIVDRMSGKTL